MGDGVDRGMGVEGWGYYLYKVQRVEHGLQQGPGPGQLGVEDDNRGAHGVTPPQLLHEVVEALLCPTHYHVVGQLSNLLSTAYLQGKTTDSSYLVFGAVRGGEGVGGGGREGRP